MSAEQLDLAGAYTTGAGNGVPPSPQEKAPLPVTYESIKAINWSSLKNMAVSPLLYRRRLEVPRKDTTALAIGRAIHCAIFEPHLLMARYAVYDGTRRGKDWDAWQMEHPGVESLKPGEMERVERTADAVRKHRKASQLVAACRVEEVTTWQDPETGLQCKGRFDSISPAYVLDVKSTADEVVREFRSSSSGYLYHGQLAFYHDGATIARKIPGDHAPWIIAVQKEEPYDVWPFELPEVTVAAGRALYRSLLRRLVQCHEADWWPGQVPDSELLELTPWAEGQNVSTEEGF